MKEFFAAINEYPWTAGIVAIYIYILLRGRLFYVRLKDDD